MQIDPDFRWFSIDPGDVHVGWCEWFGSELVDLREMSPDETILHARPIEDSLFVIETYALYPHKAQLQQGSLMQTSQLIGALRTMAYFHGCRVRMQPAAWKQPMLGALRRRSTTLSAKKAGMSIHVQDAELHGRIFLERSRSHDEWSSILHTKD